MEGSVSLLYPFLFSELAVANWCLGNLPRVAQPRAVLAEGASFRHLRRDVHRCALDVRALLHRLLPLHAGFRVRLLRPDAEPYRLQERRPSDVKDVSDDDRRIRV